MIELIEQEMQVEGFELRVWFTGISYVLDYYKDDTQAATLSFKPASDGLNGEPQHFEWEKFRVLDDYKTNGMYTAALKFSIEHLMPCYIKWNVNESQFYQDTGFIPIDDEHAKLDEEKARKWLDR